MDKSCQKMLTRSGRGKKEPPEFHHRQILVTNDGMNNQSDIVLYGYMRVLNADSSAIVA